MIDKDQCPAHTRTPWGTSEHRYNHRLRYFGMGLLCAAAITIFTLACIVVSSHGLPGFSDGDDDILGIDDDMISKDVFLAALPQNPKKDQDQNHNPGGVFLNHIPSLGSCGEMLGNCKASSIKNFCCPFATACFDTEWSPSGIYCCPDGQECEVSEDKPPECIQGTFQCNADEGGGCCPEGTTCSSHGCRRIFVGASEPSELNGDGHGNSHPEPHDSSTAATQTYSHETVATAVLPEDMATHTIVKFGEVAHTGEGNMAALPIPETRLLGIVFIATAFVYCG